MKVIITGGAGFIGSNAAEYYARKKWDVVLFDNLSRRGSEENKKYLEKRFPKKIVFIRGDVSKRKELCRLYRHITKADLILHLAAQTAVTTSLKNPVEDFEANALGSLNLLELVREIKEKEGVNPIIIYSSTNKVYGKMTSIQTAKRKKGYIYQKLSDGISECVPLDFHSPYGCSKGCADQYFRDYARIYGLKTIVFRQSCIYGPNQYGISDQGWISWFILAGILGKPITIFGDGLQTRDILYIDDLIRAYELARKDYDKLKSHIYNIGGGSKNKISIISFLNLLERKFGIKTRYKFSDWREGDQKVCVMDTRAAFGEFGWRPLVGLEEGIERAYYWVLDKKEKMAHIISAN